MPRTRIAKEIYRPSNPSNRVKKRMQEGHDLLESERLERTGFDEAQTEANKASVDELITMLEKLSGHEADTELSEELWADGFRRNKETEWEKNGVLLKSETACQKFPTHARRLAALDKMRHLKACLNGVVYFKGTPTDFRDAMRIAFDAGVAFADAERTKEHGNKKNGPFTMALHGLFEKAAEKHLKKPDKSWKKASDLTPTTISLEINNRELDEVYNRFNRGKKLDKRTLGNRIGIWLKAKKQG